ncbi:MAG: hypothetical protein IKO72_03730 [Kiritimatiellae bacterium]|nr:hypothetical protein [Kiritimatiellia bacterium]
MVKPSLIRAIAVSTTLVCGVYSEGITNIIQCINTNLTADVLMQFPTNATATAQNCVLAFVKGSVSGDLKMFASPFSNQILSSEFGVSSLDSIPASVSNEFSVLMLSISNCTNKVISYNETTNNGVIKANITLHRQGENYNRAEVSHLDITQTNNVWRIINWDVDE